MEETEEEIPNNPRNFYDRIDFAALVGYIRKEGFTSKDIADRTGFSKYTINTLFTEAKDTIMLDKTVNLLLMFREETGLEFPKLGEYHEVVPLDTFK